MNTDEMMTVAGVLWARVAELAISYSVSLLGAIILTVGGFTIAGFLERWLYRVLGHFSFDETLRRFFSKIIRYAVLVMVGITVLAQFGVQTASIIAALGAAGLAIGLALQGTLQNIAAGIMLLILKPFRVGEYIDAGGIAGTVEEIGLFATQLTTFDGVYVLTPNSELWNRAVTNFSRNPTRRHDLRIRISHDEDIEAACEVLMMLAQGDKRVLAEPPAQTMVQEIGESAIIVSLRYWTTTADFWQTRFDLTKAAKQVFDEKGIKIPYPQHEVHLIPLEGEASR